MKKLLTSKKFVVLIKILGLSCIGLVIFLTGIFVGYHKAEFSSRFSDRYYNAFGQHPHSPFAMMGAPDMDDLISGHGAAGKVISTHLPTIIVSDANGVEKSVILNNSTIIRSARNSMASTSVNVDDFIVVMGTPDQHGNIEAKLIRIMPNPNMLFASTTNNQTSTSSDPRRMMMYPQ
jgi:hypothetical protein